MSPARRPGPRPHPSAPHARTSFPALQMREAIESARADEAARRALREQEWAALRQRMAEVGAEADELEARSRDLQGQLEKLKAGERGTHLTLERATRAWGAQSPAGHLEAFCG